MLYAALYVGGVEVMFYVLEVMRCVLLCMLEAVEGVSYGAAGGHCCDIRAHMLRAHVYSFSFP